TDRRGKPPRHSVRRCPRYRRPAAAGRLRPPRRRRGNLYRALRYALPADARPARHGNGKSARRPKPRAGQPPLLPEGGGTLCGALLRSGREDPRHLLDRLRLGLGTAREPAEAVETGIGEDAAGRRPAHSAGWRARRWLADG